MLQTCSAALLLCREKWSAWLALLEPYELTRNEAADSYYCDVRHPRTLLVVLYATILNTLHFIP